MLKRPVITLTSDFGTRDPFAGIMKGVILTINPDAEIVDISHSIAPQNVLQASLVLSMSARYFPPGSIHVAVVDPGVGSDRRPVLVVSQDHFFIGPDNGIFTHILGEKENFQAYYITSGEFCLPDRGPTFHGRDIFAPAAAWLSRGIDPSSMGSPINDCTQIPIPAVASSGRKGLLGEVIYIDSFGNAITNITKELVQDLQTEHQKKLIHCACRNLTADLASNYEQKRGSGLSAIVNSFDLLELFIYRESAADKHGILAGDKVSVVVVE